MRLNATTLYYFLFFLLAGLIQAPIVVRAAADCTIAAGTAVETISIGSDEIKIHYGAHLIYVVGQNPDTAPERAKHPEDNYLVKFRLPVEYKGRLAVNNNLCKVSGKTLKVVFSTSDPKIMTVQNGEDLKDNPFFEDQYGAGVIEIWSEGDVVLTASCGDAFTKISFHIVRIPVNDHCGQDKMIDGLGLPDKQTKKFVEWPNSETIDGLIYLTRGGSGLTVEHWMYNKYPGAIFELSGGSLVPFVKQAEWETLRLAYFELDHADQN